MHRARLVSKVRVSREINIKKLTGMLLDVQLMQTILTEYLGDGRMS